MLQVPTHGFSTSSPPKERGYNEQGRCGARVQPTSSIVGKPCSQCLQQIRYPFFQPSLLVRRSRVGPNLQRSLRLWRQPSPVSFFYRDLLRIRTHARLSEGLGGHVFHLAEQVHSGHGDPRVHALAVSVRARAERSLGHPARRREIPRAVQEANQSRGNAGGLFESGVGRLLGSVPIPIRFVERSKQVLSRVQQVERRSFTGW